MAGKQVQQQHTIDRNRRAGGKILPGTYIGEVMGNKDVMQKAGRLWVFIPDFGGVKADPSSWMPVSYASPFYGISPHTAPAPTGGGTAMGGFAGGSSQVADRQQSGVTTYGFWAIPPDVGVRVLCTFVDGAESDGYWFAVVPTVSHGMIPANGAPDGKSPMMDFNPLDPAVPSTADLSSIERQPYQPLVTQFTTQGINEDPLRGPITSSSFRESPSRVFGISSQSTPTAPGHTFVMDDGDEGGKNKLIRLRTANGSQITMHDDTGMIYMINASGTGWLEISPSGQIDVFGAAGINLATNGDINLHADKNVSIHAGECLKLVGMKSTKLMGSEELQLHGNKTMIEGVESLHMHSCVEMMITSFKDIHMKAFNYFCLKGKCFHWNSCVAKEAEQVPPEEPSEVSGYNTTVARAPSKEPYKEHDTGQQQGAAPTAADGSASATGEGGMFGGGATAIPGVGGMDTAATSLGTNNFSLGFKTGLAGNTVKANPSSSFSATSVTGGGSSGGFTFNASSPIVSGNTKVDYTTINKANANKLKIQNAAKTSVTANKQPTQQTDTDLLINRPAGTTQAGPMATSVTTPASLTDPTTNTTITQQNAAQSQDVFGSKNPADQAMTGNSPAQSASDALGQMGGQAPSSDLPPAAGGGSSGCFATGDNCERPEDQTGGGNAGGGDSATPGQKNYTPPEELKNDPEFQAKLAEMKEKYPGLTDQQIYNVIGGESGYNWAATNPSGATGGFQFMPKTAEGLGYSTAQIQAMTPAQQLGVYDKYLSSNGYKGGPLGIMQAAPAYAGASGNTVVYGVGTAAWRQNPGWRPAGGGGITVNSINHYYGY